MEIINNLKIINEINIICPIEIEFLKDKLFEKIYNILSIQANKRKNIEGIINIKEIENNNNNNINIKNNFINYNNIQKNKLFNKDDLKICKEIDLNFLNKLIFTEDEKSIRINKLIKFFEIIFKNEEKNIFFDNFSLSLNNPNDLQSFYYIFDFLKNNKNEIYKESLENISDYKMLKEYDELIHDFNNKNDYICFGCEKKVKKKFCKYCQNIIDIHDKNSNIINDLNNIFYSLYYNIFNQKIFYIGILGNKGTGKSLIYNNILGIDILTTNENECTKRGIIIEDGEEYALFNANLEKDYLKEKNFYVFKKLEKIASGKNNIKKVLELLNLNYAKNTDMQNSNYFILVLPIKFFNENKLDKNLRKSIKFIDLPGFNKNAKNKFDLEDLLESISCLIINFKESEINDLGNSNNDLFLKTLKSFIKQDSQPLSNNFYLKSCLFNINIWENNNIQKEIDLKIFGNKIKQLINNIFKNKNENFELNITHINGLTSSEYLIKQNLFTDYKYLFDNILNKYQQSSTKLTFIEFFSKTLKEYISTIFKENENNIKNVISDEHNDMLYKKINELFENNIKYTGYIPKYDNNFSLLSKDICSYLSFANKNIHKIDDYKKFGIKNFYEDLKKQIIFINNIIINKNKILFEQFFKKFNQLFNNNNKVEEKINVLFYKKYFLSFMNYFEKYKLDIPLNDITIKEEIEKKEEYYKTIIKVENIGPGDLNGNCKSFDWSNGICEENKKLNIYKKLIEIGCHGKLFQKRIIEREETFDDIIVGWKIESRWRDGTNGEWKLKENPLLKKKIDIKFISQRFRGERFDIYIYLMKYP